MFLMTAHWKDCTERVSAVALSIGLIISRELMRFGSSGPSEFGNALIGMAWEDAIQGLGMAMSTVVSEKNGELLFIGNVFYKQ